MAIERTLAILKPGVLQRRLVGEILTRIEKKGFSIIGIKMMRMDRALAEKHYSEHTTKPFFSELIDYMTSSPCIALVLQGEEAVHMFRSLCGSTLVLSALPGTIRGDFASHTELNLVHASDSIESALREIQLFFNADELHGWKDGNNEWI